MKPLSQDSWNNEDHSSLEAQIQVKGFNNFGKYYICQYENENLDLQFYDLIEEESLVKQMSRRNSL